MQPYDSRLKLPSRRLRTAMTDAEQRLWFRVRRKQLVGVQFYRQKPLLHYIVDFFAPAAGLVVEVDGGQHADAEAVMRDTRRGAALASLGLRVIRFDNLQVLRETDAVVEAIYGVVMERVRRG
jgi:very-short-patch-repair endonuclease